MTYIFKNSQFDFLLYPGGRQRCLHGLPSFLRYFCDPSGSKQKQRMDRSTFSERSDANVDRIIMSDDQIEHMIEAMAADGKMEENGECVYFLNFSY